MSLIDNSLNTLAFNFINKSFPVPDVVAPPTIASHVKASAYYFAAIPVEVATRLVDLILGVGGLIATLATLGKVDAITNFTLTHNTSAFRLIPTIMKTAVLALNPQAKIQKIEVDPGLVTAKFLTAAGPGLEKLKQHPNAVVKNLLGRMAIISSVLTAVITATVDLIFGAIAFAFSVVTLGTWEKCNNFSCKNLNSLELISFMSGMAIKDLISMDPQA